MNTTKLKDALVDLQRQRAMMDKAIATIQQVITMDSSATNGSTPVAALGKEPRLSYIDHAVEILGAAGNPMHVKDLAQHIGDARGAPVERASLESSIIRHIKTNDNPRVVKTKAAHFGLPSWDGYLTAVRRHETDA